MPCVELIYRFPEADLWLCAGDPVPEKQPCLILLGALDHPSEGAVYLEGMEISTFI